MSRPKLLDLFSGAGGCSMGYHLAGFDVVGVDCVFQKRYPFDFVQMDWLVYLQEHGHNFDAFHASPPCQCYSVLKHMTTRKHADLIAPVREALRATGKPYVIENVVGAPLLAPLLLCGGMFDLQTSCGAQLRRHRLFESNLLLMSPGPCQHGKRPLAVNGHEFRNEATRWAQRRVIGVYGSRAHDPARYRAQERGLTPRTISVAGGHARDKAHEWERVRTISVSGKSMDGSPTALCADPVHRSDTQRETFTVEEARRAMGIDWMTMRELSQAIPPAYTQWIGRLLIGQM